METLEGEYGIKKGAIRNSQDYHSDLCAKDDVKGKNNIVSPQDKSVLGRGVFVCVYFAEAISKLFLVIFGFKKSLV